MNLLDRFNPVISGLIRHKKLCQQEARLIAYNLGISLFALDTETLQTFLKKLEHLRELYRLTDKLIDLQKRTEIGRGKLIDTDKGTETSGDKNVDVEKGSETSSDKLIFRVGTKFLHESYRYLSSAGDKENFAYISGIQIGNVYTLDIMQKVRLKVQTSYAAETEEQSTIESIINLDRFGHRLHATFHSHPKGFTTPSSTDKEDLQKLLNGGYKLIGAIFTMDGFVRFYSLLPFEVIIFGKGVEIIDENFYQLTHIN
jgi:hypothetical protein